MSRLTEFMSVSVSFSENGVTCIYQGTAGLQDVLEAAQKYLMHPRAANFQFILLDFSDVESFHYDEDGFAKLAAYGMENYQSVDHIPRCAVTESDELKRSLELYSELTGRMWDFVATAEAAAGWIKGRVAM